MGADCFRQRFGWYMERAAAGETFHVTRHGKPYVTLGPGGRTQAPRGPLRGMIEDNLFLVAEDGPLDDAVNGSDHPH